MVTYAKYNKLICDTVTMVVLLSNYDLQDFLELRNIILFESESYQKNFNWGKLLYFLPNNAIIHDHYI